MSASPAIPPKPMQGKYDGRKGNGNANFGRFMRARMRRELMDKAIVALSQSLDSPDKQLEAAKFVIEQTIGKAPIASTETKRLVQDNRLQVAIANLIIPREERKLVSRPTLALDQSTVTIESTEDSQTDPSSREGPPIK